MPNFSGSGKTFGGVSGGVSGGTSGGKGKSSAGGSGLGAVFGRLSKPALTNKKVTAEDVRRAFNPNRPAEKGSKSGNIYQKPGEDNMAAAQALASAKPLSDVEKAVLQDRNFNQMNKKGLDVAQGLLGLMPSNVPMGAAFGLGRWMNEKVNEDAMANPDRYRTIPGMIGGVQSVSGPRNANRALPGPSAKTTEAGGTKKKKQQPLPTLLGASANPLGTFSNPVMIT